MTEVLVTAVTRGVTALLGGHVKGTDHDRLLSSAEPGLEGGLDVAALIQGTVIKCITCCISCNTDDHICT